MNPFKKIYCRAFQICFRIALPILPYREPKILSSTDMIPKVLKSKSVKRVLLVTDTMLRVNKVTSSLENALREKGIGCFVYDKVQPNPTVINVEDALRIYNENSCQAIIAFGGGSPMDCAKAVGARVAYPDKTLDDMKGILRIIKKIPLLIAVPTTAGTGSEVTLASVITDSEKKHKYTMNSFPLIPRYAVLDPAVTYSLPKHLTATTGMDALTHAVEAYIGRSTTRKTRRMAIEAVKLIFENIETAYNDPLNQRARENMLRASYLAGAAFTQSYVGYVHAVAHSLGGQYNIPHGLANSVLLPIVLEDYGKSAHNKLHKLAVAVSLSKENDKPSASAEKFISHVRELNKKMDIGECFTQIAKADIPTMSKHADKEANPLYPVPKLMNAKELEKFYYKVYDWSKDDAG